MSDYERVFARSIYRRRSEAHQPTVEAAVHEEFKRVVIECLRYQLKSLHPVILEQRYAVVNCR